ncbi:MAG: type III pantothenate kinase [Methylacidiphilales bacterium]|nr:type III pantothenate kinase [Candidatus Methylacidiphilales bacterium]
MSAPNFLLIDIGNTRLKWATAGPRGPIRVAGDVATTAVTPGWIASLARKYPGHRAVLASVVPKPVPAFRRAFTGRLIEISAALPEPGFRFHYPKPAEIGADRLAAAVAAHARGLYPAIIVACGTATAFTVLDAKGRLCGGVIAPGLQAQQAALLDATAQLPATALRLPRSALARSTRDAIRAGVILNFQGGVKEIVHRLSEALPGRRLHVLLTGGNARHLGKNPGFPAKLRPLLVFEGLHIIGLRTRTKTL